MLEIDVSRFCVISAGMNTFQKRSMVLSQKNTLQSTQDNNLGTQFWRKNNQNSTNRLFFKKMIFHTLAFKVLIFASDLEF